MSCSGDWRKRESEGYSVPQEFNEEPDFFPFYEDGQAAGRRPADDKPCYGSRRSLVVHLHQMRFYVSTSLTGRPVYVSSNRRKFGKAPILTLVAAGVPGLSQNSESRRNRATLLVPRLRLGMHDLEAPPPL